MGRLRKLIPWLAFLFSLLGLFSWRTVYAEGEGSPAWINSLPAPDAFYRFYVGRGSSNESERDAFSEAYSNAQEQALKENFGVETQIRNQSYQTEKEGILTKNIFESSGKVRLKNFEQVEFFREVDAGLTKVLLKKFLK